MDMLEQNPGAKGAGMLVGTIVGGVWITSLVYLGIYAYNNPDPATCWVVRDLDSGFLTKEEVIARAVNVDIDIVDGYPMEMHKVYTAWFMWGFWAKVIWLTTSIVLTGVSFANAYVAKMLGAINCGLYLTNGALWLILGAVWRFAQPGMVASGDKLTRPKNLSDDDWKTAVSLAKKDHGYQIQSGRFIKYYTSICFWAILLAVIAMAVTGLTVTFCDPRKKGEADAEAKDEEAAKSTAAPAGGRQARAK